MNQKFSIKITNTKNNKVHYYNFTIRRVKDETDEQFINYIKKIFIPDILRGKYSIIPFPHNKYEFNKLLNKGDIL